MVHVSLSAMNIFTVLAIGFVVLWEITFSHAQPVGLTVIVPPRYEECFYHNVDKVNRTMDIHFSVTGSQGSEFDINFQLMDTFGRPVITEFRKVISSVSFYVKNNGTFKLCFDNTFSRLSAKTVAFVITFDHKTNAHWGKYNRSVLAAEEKYDMQVEDIRAIIQRVRIQLNGVQSNQDAYRAIESRGREVCEDAFRLVNIVSLLSITVMIASGIAQICAIKSLLDNKSAFQMLFDMFKQYIG